MQIDVCPEVDLDNMDYYGVDLTAVTCCYIGVELSTLRQSKPTNTKYLLRCSLIGLFISLFIMFRNSKR